MILSDTVTTDTVPADAVAADADTTEAHELSRLLVRISEASKANFEEIAASVGLPVPLARAIVLLARPAPMRNLAEQLSCDRSYITSIADQLEERGLVDRVPGADRRIKLLQLTDAGRAASRRISQAVSERALVMRRLDAAQRRALRPLLEALADESGLPIGEAQSCG